MKDLISIIIPVYNVSDYLDKCLESIVNQTYKKIEIIIIDDGSTDNSGNICDKWANIDSRIKVYHQENKGLSCARNLGIKKSTGKYLFFIDSDDFVSLDIIEFLYNSLINNNADIATCMNYRKKYKNLGNKSYICNKEESLKKLLYQENCLVNVWGKLYKKELFNDVLFPKKMILEDLATTYLLFSKSKKTIINTIGKYYYVKRNDSIINSKFSRNRMIGLDIANNQTKFIKTNFPKLEKAAINREFMEAIYILVNMPLRGYKKEFIKIKNVLKNTRKIVLLDKNSLLKYRIYALFSYFGLKKIIIIHRLFILFKGVI